MPVYLDNSATTQPSPAVIDAVASSMREGYYNPSALYAPALAAEQQMSACREAVAGKVNAKQVFFTSGGTEANNLAIFGMLKSLRGVGKVLYSAGEHPSVRETCKQTAGMGFTAAEIPLDQNGLVNLSALETMLDNQVRMICVMHVNNETGAVQPIEEISKLREKQCPDAVFHVDGVQGFLRIPMDMAGLQVDSYALSGHKIHAGKGVGALALGGRGRLNPIMFGGGQEKGFRSGTENTPGIAGLKAAIELFPAQHEMRKLKLRLYEKLKNDIDGLVVNGPPPESASAAPHILNVSFMPVRAETMLHALEGEGIFVGNGSACSSRKKQISHVLSAMNCEVKQAESAIRFSLSPYTTQEEIDIASDACVRQYELLKDFVRR